MHDQQWLLDLFAAPQSAPLTGPLPIAPVPTTPTPAAAPTRRHFYRCIGCLEVYALEAPLRLENGRTVSQCGNCDQRLEYMGRTERDRLITEHTACACDDRCTAARGPLCQCKCLGKNHGAGMAGYVTTTTDRGPVPVVQAENPFRLTKAREAWKRYQALRAPIAAERDRLVERKSAGEYLGAELFTRMRILDRALLKAWKARTHHARMRTLESVQRTAAL